MGNRARRSGTAWLWFSPIGGPDTLYANMDPSNVGITVHNIHLTLRALEDAWETV